jgi:ADP-heptose:LPS heptosyltransferase
VPRLKALLAITHSMISVDTGPAHFAAAMGCPLVVMFGSGVLSLWTPRGIAPGAVRALGGPPARNRVDAISPDEVIEAWRALPAHAAPSLHVEAELTLAHV